MNSSYQSLLAVGVEKKYRQLENRIMQDIVRRIVKTGEITSTADWQLNRFKILGNSAKDIEDIIKETVGDYPSTFELYDEVIDREYTRSKSMYEQVNETFIPYEQNPELQQLTDALINQSNEELFNITKSLGFKVSDGHGGTVFWPLSEYYNKYLDDAIVEITSGAFDYNTVIRRVVSQMTNSGLRTVEYASGHTSRCDVAARRAIMTGLSQLTSKVTDMNAQKLRTDYFEVDWHANARPSHRVWQGKVYSKEELVTVCGLGSGSGILGWNCYHTYYPFIPGISERNYTDSWLAEQNRKEDMPKRFRGREYTGYEATQKQRQMETAMRAQRQKVRLLQQGKADPDDIIIEKCKYQAQLDEYRAFSDKMGLQMQRERIYYDLHGRVATNTKALSMKYSSDMLHNAGKDSNQYSRYKSLIGDSIGPLADFRQMKYNKPKEFELLKKKAETYSDIDKKNWSPEFKQKSKDAYVRFEKESIYLSVHALSRLPRLNKPGYPNIEESDVLTIAKKNANYSDGESKSIFFDSGKQLVVVKNKETDDIVSIVRRKVPKEVWERV